MTNRADNHTDIHHARRVLNAALPVIVPELKNMGDGDVYDRRGVAVTAIFRHVTPDGPVFAYRVEVAGFAGYLTSNGKVQTLARI